MGPDIYVLGLSLSFRLNSESFPIYRCRVDRTVKNEQGLK